MPAKSTTKKTTASRRGAPKKATDAAVSKFEEEFAKSMGSGLSSKPRKALDVVSTGSLNLDYSLVVGGTPTGRIIETWGPEHAGKTTLAIIEAIEYQKKFPHKRVAWVDMEQTFDDKWAQQLGLDFDKWWFYTPETAEDVADAVKRFVRSGLCSYVVLDSVGGMITRMEIEKEADEATVGKVPQVVTRMVKIASPAAAANGTTLHVINQVRAQIGGYGPDEDTGGGWALKHVTTMKRQVRRVGGAGAVHEVKFPGDDRPVPVGHQMAVRIQKNKMGPSGRVANIWLHNVATEKFGPIGIDRIKEAFDFAKRFGFMGSKGGGYYQFGEGDDMVEVRGEDAALEHLRQHPEVVEDLRQRVLATLADEVIEDVEEAPADLGMGEMVD